MTTPDPLSNMTQLLRGVVADEGDVEAMPPRRDEAIAALASALHARRAAVRRRRYLGGLAVAAAVSIAVGSGFALHHQQAPLPSPTASQLGKLVGPAGAATALRDGRTESVNGGDRVAEGTELRTTNAEASLDFESGTHVTFGRASRVRLVEQTAHKRFSLESGELAASVAKLHAGETFVVTTSDAEIEVRGTAFRVSIVAPDAACENGTPTRLEVTEGVVVVRRGGVEARVPAGSQWPSCAVNPARTVAELRSATVVEAPPVKPPQPIAHASSSAASSSLLAEQNDLFDEGMRLKRAGDLAGALAKFEKLTSTYPGGPLTESATVERMRVLASTDKARASAAAREYTRRYPHGFARKEAEALGP